MHPIQEAQAPSLVGELIYTLHAAGHHWKKKKKTNTVVSIVKVLVIQACPTLCDPMDCSLQGSSVYGVLQARILEGVAIPFSRVSSQPRNQTRVSSIVGRFLTVQATREAPNSLQTYFNLIMNNSTQEEKFKLCFPKSSILSQTEMTSCLFNRD